MQNIISVIIFLLHVLFLQNTHACVHAWCVIITIINVLRDREQLTKLTHTYTSCACVCAWSHHHHAPPPLLTSLLGRLVVRLAHKPAVLHQVVLVARGQLPLAHDAGEAVQVVHEVLRPAHHLRRGDALLARSALGPKSPFGKLRGQD